MAPEKQGQVGSKLRLQMLPSAASYFIDLRSTAG
jgi:hypothetical protein